MPGCCLCNAGLIPHQGDHVVSPTYNPDDPLYPRSSDFPIPCAMSSEEALSGLNADLFAQIGKRVCMLPQTVAHICDVLGLENLVAIAKTALKYRNLVRVSHPSDEYNIEVSMITAKSRWRLSDDLELIQRYLSLFHKTLKEQPRQGQQNIIDELIQKEDVPHAVVLRLGRLEKRPYISNPQIVRLACFVYASLGNFATQTAKVLGLPEQLDALSETDRLTVDYTVEAYLTGPTDVAPREVQDIRKHPQVQSVIENAKKYLNRPTEENWSSFHQSIDEIKDWVPFFAFNSLQEKGPAPQIERRHEAFMFLQQFSDEDDSLLTPRQETFEFCVAQALERHSKYSIA